MFRATSFAIPCLLASTLFAQAVAETVGTAACDRYVAGEQCRVTWDFARTPRAYYWVQRLDPETGRWGNLDASYTDVAFRSIRPQPVAAGHLYRVLACNDPPANQDCVSSTVLWAPVVPRNEEEARQIPEIVTMTRPDGIVERFQVSKSMDTQFQALQYNVYLLARSLGRTRPQDLPEMTRPPDISQGDRRAISDTDRVLNEVYAAYLAARGDTSLLPPQSEETPAPLTDHLPRPRD